MQLTHNESVRNSRCVGSVNYGCIFPPFCRVSRKAKTNYILCPSNMAIASRCIRHSSDCSLHLLPTTNRPRTSIVEPIQAFLQRLNTSLLTWLPPGDEVPHRSCFRSQPSRNAGYCTQRPPSPVLPPGSVSDSASHFPDHRQRLELDLWSSQWSPRQFRGRS